MSHDPYRFPTTRWSELAVIREGPTAEKRSALASLAERYRIPVLAFLVAEVRDPVFAEDLVQEFFLHALETDFFRKAAANRGKFRSFLLRSLQNFLISEHRKREAQMRAPPGGFVEPTPEGSLPEAVERVTPAAIFDRAWVCNVIRTAVDTLREQCQADGREVQFAVLNDYVINPALEGIERPTMRELSTKYGLSPKQIEVRLNAGRESLKQEFLREVSFYAVSPEEETEEFEALVRALNLQ